MKNQKPSAIHHHTPSSAANATLLAPSPAGQMGSVIESLEKESCHLHEIVGQLEIRLCDLLEPVPSNGDSLNKVAEPPQSIVDRIRQHTFSVGAAHERLESLLARLHV